MHRPRLTLLILLLVTLASCASSPPAPATASPAPTAPAAMQATTPAPETSADLGDMATIVIYRDRAFVGSLLRPTVMLDGKDLVNVGNGRVYKGYFKPGKYLIQMDDKKSGADLDLKAGDVYYMRVEIVPGFWKGGGRIMIMDPKQGAYESAQLTPVEAKEIPDATHSGH